MNSNIRNKGIRDRMRGSWSNNEKIIAVNDIKLNSLLINGSRVECNQVFSVRLRGNHVNLRQSLHGIRNRPLKDEEQDGQNASLLFQNTAIHKKLKRVTRICFNNSLSSLNTNIDKIPFYKQNQRNLRNLQNKIQSIKNSKCKSIRILNSNHKDMVIKSIYKNHNIDNPKQQCQTSQREQKYVMLNISNPQNKNVKRKISKLNKLLGRYNPEQSNLTSLLLSQKSQKYNHAETPSTMVYKSSHSSSDRLQCQYTTQILLPLKERRRSTQNSEMILNYAR